MLVFHEKVRDAIKYNDLKKLKTLLKHGFDLAHDFKHGWTALHLVCREGKLEMVRLLLEHKANVNAENNLWRTPLDEALKSGHSDIVDFLSQHGGQRGCEHSLLGAITSGEEKWVKKQLADGADINALNSGQLPLCIAIERRQPDIIHLLLNKKPDVRKIQTDGDTPMHIAATKGSDETILKGILELGADINAVNKYGQTPISLAARHGHYSVAIFLLQNGAKAYFTSDEFLDPVSEAICHGHESIARVLIDHGGKATLSEAINCAHLATVRRLINEGDDINAQDDSGRTPLIDAIYPEIVELLLESGADPNLQTAYTDCAESPLHAAVRQDSARYVKMLLARGADPDVQDSRGTTPLALALQNGYKHLARLMETHLDKLLQKKAVEQLFTINKVAEILSVDEGSVMALLKRGKLRQVKLDSEKIRIPESSLARYFSELRD